MDHYIDFEGLLSNFAVLNNTILWLEIIPARMVSVKQEKNLQNIFSVIANMLSQRNEYGRKKQNALPHLNVRENDPVMHIQLFPSNWMLFIRTGPPLSLLGVVSYIISEGS